MSALPEIIYRGSVKDVRGVEGQSPYTFEYSDRYSVYDWGQMPDGLTKKGEALAFMAGFFFKHLGLPHHALGEAEGTLLKVKPVSVLRPEAKTEDGKILWDYSAYQSRPVNTLVPLEVIFRFGVPEGSSMLKRASDPAWRAEAGLQAEPKTGDRFEKPVIEFSTKLENKDRYISRAEAAKIAGMDSGEMHTLIALVTTAAEGLRACFEGIGVELWDGKFEFGFTGRAREPRGFMLVDSIGPDELRLTLDGLHLSKEWLRSQYKGSSWLAAAEKAKKLADERGVLEWKEICTKELGESPKPLSADAKEKGSMIYLSLAEALAKKYLYRSVFPEAWPLDQLARALEGKAAA